jgi:hypothetical protein
MVIQLLIGRQAGMTMSVPAHIAGPMLRDGRALPKCDAARQCMPVPKKRKRGRPRKKIASA